MQATRSWVFGMVVLGVILAAPHPGSAQVAIYKLQFEQTGLSVNYRPFEEGFFVMPLEGGDVTFIFQFQDGLGRQLLQSENLGIFFTLTEGSSQKGVLATADGDSTPTNFFTAIGKLDETLRATVITTDPDTDENSASIVSRRLPSELRGFVLTADDTGSGITDNNTGSAGACELKAFLDVARSNSANRRQDTVADAVEDLVAQLLRVGYVDITPAGEEETGNNNQNP